MEHHKEVSSVFHIPGLCLKVEFLWDVPTQSHRHPEVGNIPELQERVPRHHLQAGEPWKSELRALPKEMEFSLREAQEGMFLHPGFKTFSYFPPVLL